MAYSTVSDVQSLVKWITFGSSSKVTSTEVTDFHIVNADAYIDAKLGAKYVVPITDSDDIKILNFISARLAACKVAEILVLQTSGRLPEIVSKWCKDAEKRLNDILDFDILLPNSTKHDSTRGLWSYTAHGDADNDYAETDPVWELSKDQW